MLPSSHSPEEYAHNALLHTISQALDRPHKWTFYYRPDKASYYRRSKKSCYMDCVYSEPRARGKLRHKEYPITVSYGYGFHISQLVLINFFGLLIPALYWLFFVRLCVAAKCKDTGQHYVRTYHLWRWDKTACQVRKAIAYYQQKQRTKKQEEELEKANEIYYDFLTRNF